MQQRRVRRSGAQRPHPYLYPPERQDLTGRENVFPQGAMIDMKRWYPGTLRSDGGILRYQQVHRHAGSALPIIDELLSVGDAFQQRALDRINAIVSRNPAAALVSLLATHAALVAD